MWLKFLALSALFIGCFCDPKHFLVIIADDFGWGDVSMHGTGGMLKLKKCFFSEFLMSIISNFLFFLYYFFIDSILKVSKHRILINLDQAVQI